MIMDINVAANVSTNEAVVIDNCKIADCKKIN
jgi:hypothetical protein